jgi:hypothetical protein
MFIILVKSQFKLLLVTMIGSYLELRKKIRQAVWAGNLQVRSAGGMRSALGRGLSTLMRDSNAEAG